MFIISTIPKSRPSPVGFSISFFLPSLFFFIAISARLCSVHSVTVTDDHHVSRVATAAAWGTALSAGDDARHVEEQVPAADRPRAAVRITTRTTVSPSPPSWQQYRPRTFGQCSFSRWSTTPKVGDVRYF